MAKETPEERQYREAVEAIAENIARLSREVKAMLGGRLKMRTVVILLTHSCQLPQSTVKSVLEALSNMEGDYLNK